VVLFFIIFKFLPSRRIVWRTALVAAVFCALGFEVARRLYALYVTRFATLDRVASDANIVALFLFLLWIYYTAYLFLLGGEVAETYDLVRMRRSQRVQLG
jgi:membrane protein